MFETVVGGLMLAAVSALTFLAYNHPKQFKAISPWLLGLGFLTYVAAWVWNFALSSARSATYSALSNESENIDKAYDAISALEPPTWLMVIGFPAWMFFLLILHLGVTRLRNEDDRA